MYLEGRFVRRNPAPVEGSGEAQRCQEGSGSGEGQRSEENGATG